MRRRCAGADGSEKIRLTNCLQQTDDMPPLYQIKW